VADISSLIWSHVRHVVPSASCAFFVSDAATDRVKVAFVGGAAASMLQGLEMKVGERLTGWVAANRQPIINSEAKLDLGVEAALAGLQYCLSFPLVDDGQLAGVLSLYAPEAFREEQTQMLAFVMPHLAQMLLSIERRAATAAAAGPRQPLRIISNR
jgi:GAF domain-containing protein